MSRAAGKLTRMRSRAGKWETGEKKARRREWDLSRGRGGSNLASGITPARFVWLFDDPFSDSRSLRSVIARTRCILLGRCVYITVRSIRYSLTIRLRSSQVVSDTLSVQVCLKL
jgi:hypothetical protein